MDSTISECHLGIQFFAVIIVAIPVHGIEIKYSHLDCVVNQNRRMGVRGERYLWIDVSTTLRKEKRGKPVQSATSVIVSIHSSTILARGFASNANKLTYWYEQVLIHTSQKWHPAC